MLRWNQIAVQAATAKNPFNQARVGAIVQLAVFEAVNAVTKDYEPYLNPPTASPAGTSIDAAAIIAAHDVLTTYFPAASVALDAARDLDLGAIPNGSAKTNGMAVAPPLPVRLIALRAADGSSPLTTIIVTGIPSVGHSAEWARIPFQIGGYRASQPGSGKSRTTCATCCL